MGGVEGFRRALWRNLSYACRYGHQDLRSIMTLPTEQLDAFLEGLEEHIKAENKSGRGWTEGMASGGG